MAASEIEYEDKLLGAHLARAMNEKPIGHFALRPFDELVGGILGGRLAILCAEPGMSKTTLFGQLADEAAIAGFMNVVNTVEIPAYQWVAKSISRLSCGELSIADIADPEKADLVNQVSELYSTSIAPNMVFLENPLPPVDLGAIIARIQSEREQPVILWHDYLQIMPPSSEQLAVDERLVVKESMAGLRRIANAHDIPVYAVSSINRNSYSKGNPDLGALGGSSAVEYGADTVVYMTVEGKREQRAANMELPVRPLKLTTLKNRYGANGTARLAFDCAHATFRERP